MDTLKRIIAPFLFLLLIFSKSLAFGQGLLYEVTGNGLEKPSYLFGTMHTKSPEVINIGSKMLPLIDSSQAFAMEIKMDESVYADIFSMLVTEEDYQLKNHLTDEQYKKLGDWFKSNYGMKLAFFERIKPIFLYIMMTESGIGADKPFLDQYLSDEAKARNKEIIGLETLDEQMDALNIMTLDEQVQMLADAIDDPEAAEKEQEKMVKIYLKGKVKKLEKMIEKTTDSEEFFKVMITDRNHNMANRIANYLKDARLFIAIGAGHLPGEEGVIALLQKKGYQVEAIDYE